MKLVLTFLGLILAVTAQNGNFPEPLLCNRLYGNYITCCDRVNLPFGRPLEPGDKIIINATVGPVAGFYYVRINIRDTTGNIISLHMRSEIPTDWPLDPHSLIYNTNLGSGWGPNAYGPSPYNFNTPFQITIIYTGASYQIYSGATLIKSYALRHPPTVQLMYLELNGQYTTNWVEMDCIRPLPTTAAPTTTGGRRGGGGHGFGHHGHHHRKHHHHRKDSSSGSGDDNNSGGDSSSSSSGSQEICDD